MQRVVVVDYGMGNLRSVERALAAVAKGHAEITVSADRCVIDEADRVVFPGQGAIRDCMAEIRSRGLESVIAKSIEHKPFLGICIGLQALMQSSREHAGTEGLGVFEGEVLSLADYLREHPREERLKVPHMGWNQVWHNGAHPLWRGIANGAWFYFAHGFYVAPRDSSVIAGRTDYGLSFASAAAKGSLFAVQFHPEKSQRVGLKLLENFLAWDGGPQEVPHPNRGALSCR